jgi:hypothetical protein
MGPTLSEHHMSANAEILNPTDINYYNKSTALAKTNLSSNKHPRKSPYNTKSPKKTLTTTLDKPALSSTNETTENFTPPPLNTSSSTPPKLLEMKKRPNTSKLAPS